MILDRITAETGKRVVLPDTREELAVQGFEPCDHNLAQTAALLTAHIA